MINLLNIWGLILSQDGAGGDNEFCDAAAPLLRIVGLVIFVIKVAVPIILIVVGMVDLAKAVGEKDEKTIKEAQNRLIKRVIAAILVFLVITIVGIIFGVLGENDYKECMHCVNHPFADECKEQIDGTSNSSSNSGNADRMIDGRETK